MVENFKTKYKGLILNNGKEQLESLMLK